MTPPVQEKHEITMSMERWFRLFNSDISTAQVTYCVIIVTYFYWLLSYAVSSLAYRGLSKETGL
jgi:hypothetical protein